MSTLSVTAFTGEIPRLMSRLLPDMAASLALNTRLTSGGLSPIRLPRMVVELDDPPPNDEGTIYLHNDEWLSWPGLVHAVPGPVASDRLYVTGDGVPKMIVNGSTYDLALAAPSAKLTAAVTGTGDGETETRLYIYTFVTEFGEESEPSPVTDDIDWESGQTVTLSGFELGDAARGVDRQRIYRSQTGVEGTELFFIAERATSTADFVDELPPTAIGEVLPTTAYNPPPDDLEGIIAMPNGMMAAFVGRQVYFCEPYRPHAWPAIYILTVDYPVVALGAYGSTLAITTTGYPYVASGITPDSMVMDKLELNLPCVNAAAIVDMGYAVAYPSHEGLVTVSQEGARVATEGLFSREDWQRLDPRSFAAGQHDGRYYASYTFVDSLGEVSRGTVAIDLSGDQPFVIRNDIITRAFHYDISSGVLYYLSEGAVYAWDAAGQPNATQVWRSKEFVLAKPTNFGAILVDAIGDLTPQEREELLDFIEAVEAEREAMFEDEGLGGALNTHAVNGATVNGDLLPDVPPLSREMRVNVYADGQFKASISSYGVMKRLPSGYTARRWQIEVISDMPVEQVSLATSGHELSGV